VRPPLLLSGSLPPDRWWRAVSDVLDGGPPVHPVPADPTASTPAADDLLHGAGVVLTTSGSTGTPRHVVLDAPALLASATATLEHLGGPGQWLQALSPAQVAGWQVWVRSVVTGTPPVVMPRRSGFTVGAFVAASAQLRPGLRHYTALVPTQLRRLLADPAGAAALGGYDAVLVGGAALTPALRTAVRAQGISVVTTYGMTETAGGCVYDGTPLPGVDVDLDPDGRLLLAGPVLARGYLGDSAGTRQAFPVRNGRRWFLTSDLGEHSGDRSWSVLGRLDDVINTGAHKVLPARVEEALEALPEVAQAVVVGVPDAEWGERVAALVVPSSAAPAALRADPTATLRGRLRDSLPAQALPREVRLVTALPLLPGGKVDRRVARRDLSAGGGTL
jgi:O-succinylbenzoic acid--CoA ligase